eukprot:scaffold171053_cov35-Tisochrysis_lutea.AAC.2
MQTLYSSTPGPAARSRSTKEPELTLVPQETGHAAAKAGGVVMSAVGDMNMLMRRVSSEGAGWQMPPSLPGRPASIGHDQSVAHL